MNWKKIITGILLVFILGGIAELGLGYWINHSLPDFVNKRNDTPYNFDYSDVSYSVLRRKMVIRNITIIPKVKNKGALLVKVKKIEVHGVHFYTFLTKKDLIANQIIIVEPDIVVRQQEEPKKNKEVVTYDLGKSIKIEEFSLKKGKLQLLDGNNSQKIASLTNLNIQLLGVVWDIADKEKRIPISYQEAKLSVEDVFYQFNEINFIKLARLNVAKQNLEALNIEIGSNLTEAQFRQSNSPQKSLLNITVPTAEIKDTNWGYDSLNIFFLTTRAIKVNAAHINVVSKKSNTYKPKNLTTYVERIIPFNLRVDSVHISKSKLNLDNYFTSNHIDILIQKIDNKVDDKISIEALTLADTDINIYQKKPAAREPQSKFTYFFDDVLHVKKFAIRNANIAYYNTAQTKVLSMEKINYQMNDIVVNTLITNTTKELPYTYQSYNLGAKNLSYTALKNYSFTVDSLQLNNDAFTAQHIQVVPKLSIHQFAKQKTAKNLFKARIEKISIPKIIWDIKDTVFFIKAPAVTVNNLRGDIYSNKGVKPQNRKLRFHDSDAGINLAVDNFTLTRSSLNLYNAANNQLTTSTEDLNLVVNNIAFNNQSKNITLGLPISFSRFNLTAKKVFQDMDTHTLNVDNLSLKNNYLIVHNLNLKPKASKNSLMRKKGIDAYTLHLSRLEIPKLDLGLPNREIQLTAPRAVFSNLTAVIHQYDIPDADYVPVYKPLFSEKLRKLKFKLQLGQVNLKNSHLAYEEESLDKGIGRIDFNNIQAIIYNVNSGYNAGSLPKVRVDFKSKFMGTGNLSALWEFDIMNTNDNFTVKGKITHLPAQKINKFIKPYLNVSAEGMLDEVVFDYFGNNNKGNGNFGMNYKNLQVTLYKKNGKTERKLLSGIANLAVKKNTKDSLKVSKIKEVDRLKDKSFFNFLWKMTLSGLKENLLIF